MTTHSDFSEQEFDTELRKLIKTTEQQYVSDGFTKKVMGRIQEETVAQPYQPVISKRTLFIVALFFGTLVIFSLFQPANTDGGDWTFRPLFSFSFLESLNQWPHQFFLFLNQFHFSNSIALPILGLLFTLSIHYVFLAILRNRESKKTRHLYCL